MDPIKNLLDSMGWTCDDLLAKLQELKKSDSTATLKLPDSPTKAIIDDNDKDKDKDKDKEPDKVEDTAGDKNIPESRNGSALDGKPDSGNPDVQDTESANEAKDEQDEQDDNIIDDGREETENNLQENHELLADSVVIADVCELSKVNEEVRPEEQENNGLSTIDVEVTAGVTVSDMSEPTKVDVLSFDLSHQVAAQEILVTISKRKDVLDVDLSQIDTPTKTVDVDELLNEEIKENLLRDTETIGNDAAIELCETVEGFLNVNPDIEMPVSKVTDNLKVNPNTAKSPTKTKDVMLSSDLKNGLDVDIDESINAITEKCQQSKQDDDTIFKKPNFSLLHKLKSDKLKCRTSEHDYTDEKEPEPKEDVEIVRNRIREQLQLLRNKKKTDKVSSPICRDLINRPITKTLKKQLSFSGLGLGNSSEQSDVPKVNESDCKEYKLDDILLSNEGNFVIVDVVGGYKSPSPPKEIDETAQDAKLDESVKVESFFKNFNGVTKNFHQEIERNEDDTIKLTKTSDITKIKGWKHKKFSVSDVEEKKTTEATIPTVPVFEEPVASCSTSENVFVLSASPIVTEKKRITDKNSKSAFISNALDEYLNEHAQLNISYEVPKLDAEDTISQDFCDTSLPQVAQVDVTPPSSSNEPESPDLLVPATEEVYKPKTLAEKRRMLEKHIRKKNLEAKKLKMAKENKQSNVFHINFSILYYNGRKLKVPVKNPNKIMHIKSNYGQKNSCIYVENDFKEPPFKRPSLLTCMKKEDTKVTYKPGPLCMKPSLQNTDSKCTWKTVMKKLPKITIQVTPKLYKPFDPNVADFIHFQDTVLNEDRVDFALSALKTELPPDSKLKSFTFNVPFRNGQQHITLRRKILPEELIKTEISVKDETIDEAVSIVIDKLLNYVEVSEIADTLIKDDCDVKSEEPVKCSPKPPSNISKKVSAIIKSKRRARFDLELKRLNVKIIDVDVSESDEATSCDKLHCALGCVCKSLQCNSSFVPYHCGRINCMLKCSCNFEKEKLSEEDRVILPPGTNLFSSDTVNRLQREAKKDLAKVEKEFTQTVIQANDQAIVLGTGNRERQKRLKKLPKKYDDYFDETEFEMLNNDKKYVTVELDLLERVKKDIQERQSVVKLARLKCDNILPFCWKHKSYNCACNYSSLRAFPVKRANSIKDERSVIEEEEPLPKRLRTSETCSRTKVVPTEEYRLRNKKSSYLRDLKQKLKQKERELGYIRQNGFVQHVEDNLEMKVEESTSSISRHRRKQSIDAKSDVDDSESEICATHSPEPEKAIQRRKAKNVNLCSGSLLMNNTVSSLKNPAENSCLEDEYLSPTQQLIKEFNRLIGTEAADKVKFRLLPWSVLSARYYQGVIHIWFCMTTSKLVITEGSRRPSKSYVNITFFEQLEDKKTIEVDIIRWLIAKEVPMNRNTTNLMVVLTLKKNYWQICGICDKNQGTAIATTIDRNNPANGTSAEEIQDEGFLLLKNSNNEINDISVKRTNYPAVYLTNLKDICESPKDLLEPQKRVFSVQLPKIDGKQKWYMLKVSDAISYVLFIHTLYKLQLADLNKLIQSAQHSCRTICAQSEKFNCKILCRNFGIYAAPAHKDKVFIGPYNIDDLSGIEILSYENNFLVNTDLYNRMKGKKCCSSLWLVQMNLQLPVARTDAIEVIPKFGPVIDLTDNDSDGEFDVNSVFDNIKKNFPTSLHPNDSRSLLKTAVPKDNKSAKRKRRNGKEEVEEKEDVEIAILNETKVEVATKKYFITNVPGIGYIEGYQLPDSKVIDVRWPVGKHIQRFSKAEDAIMMLESDLPKIFVPVPSTFKIKVYLTAEVDPSVNKPFDLKFMHGSFIVGEFGIKDILKVNVTILKSFGLDDSEAMELLLVRSKRIIYDQCFRLAGLIQPPGGHLQKASEIIALAVEEIKKQEEKYKQLDKMKLDLEIKRSALLRKCFNVMKKTESDDQKIKLALYNLVKPHGVSHPQVLDPKENCETAEIETSSKKVTLEAEIENTSGGKASPSIVSYNREMEIEFIDSPGKLEKLTASNLSPKRQNIFTIGGDKKLLTQATKDKGFVKMFPKPVPQTAAAVSKTTPVSIVSTPDIYTTTKGSGLMNLIRTVNIKVPSANNVQKVPVSPKGSLLTKPPKRLYILKRIEGKSPDGSVRIPNVADLKTAKVLSGSNKLKLLKIVSDKKNNEG